MKMGIFNLEKKDWGILLFFFMYLKKFPSEKGNTNVIYVSKTKVLGPVGGIDKR